MKRVKYKYYVAATMLMIMAASCQKVIDLKLRNDTGKLVIEGNIVNPPGRQTVKLSQNVPFTSASTYPAVSGAAITVSNSRGNIFPFTERSAGTYSGNFFGVPGETYTLTVKTGGQTYTAVSTMPQPVRLDSVTAQKDGFGKNDGENIIVHFQDPSGIANQYRVILTVNGLQLNTIFAFNDDFFDGRYINLELFINQADIMPGDTVVVEMQCVDKPVYTYWFSLVQQDSGPGGGVSPSNPPTNITPAALGYFSAHASSFKTIVVQ
jgi:archaellum component FlaF (FlaF/FlaG flagellin family)